MRAYFRNASPELYLLVAALVSIAIAGILTRIPLLHFGTFREMSGVLVISDVLVYLLMKFGVLQSPRDGR